MVGCNTGIGAPVMYNYINQYNSSICPSTNHCKNTQLFWYFQRYLLQKAISVMKWEVPDNWDKDYFCIVYIVGALLLSSILTSLV